ncbi:hypothetical protein SAMN04487785_102439 [Dyella jiangningensis]|uniref:hypothetical protein n=1 Tax=Dyella sp. AtDHG13 TaxID=1938897 RepID=UPI000887165F|nr:hypothetical protein [Dyella sp. AtDHG13]PXV60711.1 hypothetical protein BDW41_102438 [Dyella sp. AtDHG13]SDJ56084.1 hypothetical protein SAMN04487785_102439 [Dyella jiangningensis]
MSLSTLSHDQMAAILFRGGSLKIDGRQLRMTSLHSLAATAKNGGARLTITGMGAASASDLEDLAAAGSGAVAFED